MTMDVAELIVGIAKVIATLVVAAVVFRQAQNIKRVEVHNETVEAYNKLNAVALSSVENLRTFDGIGRDGSPDTDETRRRRWCSFMWLVPLQMTYHGMKSGLIDKGYAKQSLDHQLAIILVDDLVFWVVNNRGFDPKFAEYCLEIRRKVAPGRRTDFSEIEAILGVDYDRPNAEN